MRKQGRKQTDNESVTLGDMLNDAVVQQLKDRKKDLKALEQQQLEEEAERRRQERKEREKNKSFEQLLNESNLDWEQFK